MFNSLIKNTKPTNIKTQAKIIGMAQNTGCTCFSK